MITDVIRCQIICRIAPCIRLTLPLVHAYIIDLELCWENHRWQIYRLPIRCYANVNFKQEAWTQVMMQDKYVRDIPKFKTRAIGSSDINLCPTPLPPVPWSGPTAAAHRLVVCCPFACQLMNPFWRLFGSDQYSKPVVGVWKEFSPIVRIDGEDRKEKGIYQKSWNCLHFLGTYH